MNYISVARILFTQPTRMRYPFQIAFQLFFDPFLVSQLLEVPSRSRSFSFLRELATVVHVTRNVTHQQYCIRLWLLHVIRQFTLG